jgi:hypothetical protein
MTPRFILWVTASAENELGVARVTLNWAPEAVAEAKHCIESYSLGLSYLRT